MYIGSHSITFPRSTLKVTSASSIDLYIIVNTVKVASSANILVDEFISIIMFQACNWENYLYQRLRKLTLGNFTVSRARQFTVDEHISVLSFRYAFLVNIENIRYWPTRRNTTLDSRNVCWQHNNYLFHRL